jgi:uncharacterized alpha-E superfamily protein
VGTMLQDEALHFLRVGTFLDRVGDLGVGISRDFLVPMAA